MWYLKNNMHNILLFNIYGKEVQAFLVLGQFSAESIDSHGLN